MADWRSVSKVRVYATYATLGSPSHHYDVCTGDPLARPPANNQLYRHPPDYAAAHAKYLASHCVSFPFHKLLYGRAGGSPSVPSVLSVRSVVGVRNVNRGDTVCRPLCVLCVSSFPLW